MRRVAMTESAATAALRPFHASCFRESFTSSTVRRATITSNRSCADPVRTHLVRYSSLSFHN